METYRRPFYTLLSLGLLALVSGCPGQPPAMSEEDLSSGGGGKQDLRMDDTDMAAAEDLAAPPDMTMAPSWRKETSGVDVELRDIHGSDASHVYVVGDRNTILFSGGKGSWSRQAMGVPTDSDGAFTSVFAPSNNLVLATHVRVLAGNLVTYGRILRNEGTGTWALDVNIGFPTLALGGANGGGIYAVGQRQTSRVSVFKRMAAANWPNDLQMPMTPDTGYFQDFAAASPQALYAVGETLTGAGLVYFSTGNTTWTKQTLPAGTTSLYGVWAANPNAVYAVGEGGHILFSTGNGTWTAQQSGVTTDLSAVWGSGPNDVYVVGDKALLHSRGDGTWTKVDTKVAGVADSVLYNVWGTSPTNFYVVGESGLILHYAP